jgi:ankyrin repeat protein
MAWNGTPMRQLALIVGALVIALTATDGAGATPALVDLLKQQRWDLAAAALEDGSSVNGAAADGSTPLHWAVHHDRLEIAGRLVKLGAKVDAATDLGVTPLMLACENGSAPMVQLLLQAGASTAAAPGAIPAVMTAARVGNLEVMGALLGRGADPNAREGLRHQTALMWAAANSHPQVVDALLQAGARVDARSLTRQVVVQRANRYAGVASREEGAASRAVIEIPTGGSTALLFAARVGDEQSARLLLAAGARVDEASPDGATALVTAVHSAQPDVAKLLLDKGADVNASAAGYTPLHAAVLRGDAALVSLLLDRGANIEAALQHGTPSRRYSRDYAFNAAWTGATPLWLAARFAETTIFTELLRRGASTDVTTRDGNTVLLAVITAGVEFGPSASDRRERRLDPLDVAALADNRPAFEQEALDLVHAAVGAGIDVNRANNAGDTAMHQAAVRGFPTIIEFLAARGGRIDIKNSRGATPLAMTVSRRGGDENPWVSKSAETLRRLGARE